MNETGRVLVAGIGNIFLGDDGFGVEVVRRLHAPGLPENVDVADYGIRGVHLAYELLDGRHDTLIMVDAVPLENGAPGELAVLDATDAARDAAAADPFGAPPVNGHGMHPLAVLQLLHKLGGRMGRVLVVGCRPADVEERMGLSGPVTAALDEAVRLVGRLAREEAARLSERADRLTDTEATSA
ncbi:hydrogenase maturation protease [Actinomadura algeriensis]|uniref:Hydrogenase maturation protease n=1 Tax=Actinomadura algeriensis TaxID=1679523 RepID=A0ABR9JNP7_9ACTN|nr:hydrogenase maturation protease [Actinomadura algeriensis]MBE1532191.1 hydrogenase maturation protease [Actinomadura algeriensis]